jgi:urea carboxylase
VFDTVLVANRGEIARRIIATLRRMDIRAVAVYSEADRHAAHVHDADDAALLGPAPPSQSYLRVDAILDAALRSGAQAVHPGYGFLSENAAFAEACEDAGIAFIGPTPDQLRRFGLKHTSRELAVAHDVPVLAGTGLLPDVEAAVAAAEELGFPLMVKSTAGGGGIGMGLCRSVDELAATFASVGALSAANFADAGVFLERYVDRARHVEVQIFGDGLGDVVDLGDRDCTAQRRNQKVLEEAPAPCLPDEVRITLTEAALRLGRAVAYRSAGTVEFVYDADREEGSFLEVNTRLQVEHPVTEATTGIDLVEWMVRLAAGELGSLTALRPEPRGFAVEARIYAEDPSVGYRPSTGRVMEWAPPGGVRVDGWVVPGAEISPHYDPLLAKVIATGDTRDAALAELGRALDEFRVSGIETNLDQLRHLVRAPAVHEATHTTRLLESLPFASPCVDVLEGGTHTTVQDDPGRVGYWAAGVPPSGPMDARSFRLANRLLGNPDDAAGLEIVLRGPSLRFRSPTTICIAGAPTSASLSIDGGEQVTVPGWTAMAVPAGSTLHIGEVGPAGCRAYLAVSGGFDGHRFLGSRATFDLGRFGGHGGRALLAGDVVRLLDPHHPETVPGTTVPDEHRPPMVERWEIGVLYGPHGAPDFFTDDDIATFLAAEWQVHYNSNRTGVRLIGPTPTWARPDGGEAGLHPSNIHDTVYAVGAVDFTGDMPVVLGPDGPSLGGFVCPVTIAGAEQWKMGQVRAGDTIRFHLLDHDLAVALDTEQRHHLDLLAADPAPTPGPTPRREPDLVPQATTTTSVPAVLDRRPAAPDRPSVTYRRSGDACVLVEYGDNVLDLDLRLRAHALQQHLAERAVTGVVELSPGIRSLQVRYDHHRRSLTSLVDELLAIEDELPGLDEVTVPSRVVHLPLSWDDPATQLAIEKYTQVVRPDAPWAPSNIEFIRRINGLDSVDEVRRIVLEAEYLVLGLGDVYLGAPVATPVDPRHRMVTTKYNPARTWTPENAVGIGGAYLCVYGMEGPGGYQFVGRTVPVWNHFRSPADGPPWSLRLFDRISFHLVDADELLDRRAAIAAGRAEIEVENGVFALRDHHRFLAEHRDEIVAAKVRQQAAFDEERQRWEDSGQANFSAELPPDVVEDDDLLPEGHHAVPAPLHGSVWKVLVNTGAAVVEGEPVAILEAMKMETKVLSPRTGTVTDVRCREGQEVRPGQVLVVVAP